MSRNKIVVAVVAVLVVVAAASGIAVSMGGDNDETAAPTTTTSGSEAPTTTVDNTPKAPLTGLPLADEALRNRPLITVKIDNSPQARPQFGIDRADDIVEEKVEGGVSRFMALFHSQDADQVGPVRSLRTTDVNWLKPEGGMIAYSGGIPAVRNLLEPAGITNIGGDTYGPKYYKRRGDRPFEHSMYVTTPVLRELTPAGLAGPKPLYEYLPTGEGFGGTTATPLATVQGTMGGRGATTYAWTWDPSQGKYLRTTDGQSHLIENVGQIAMTNVILQYTPYRPTQFRDTARTVVDEAVTSGSGDAWIMSGGKIVQGKWTRPTDSDITVFTDSTGAVVKLAPGQTWLQLVPQDLKANPIAG